MVKDTPFVLSRKYVKLFVKDRPPRVDQLNSVSVKETTMQRDEAIDRQTVEELCLEIGVRGFLDDRLYSKFTHHNDGPDCEFIQSYLNEMRGPTHQEYHINVLDTWKLNNLNGRVGYASEMSNHSLLMVGIPKNNLYMILRGGMIPLASNKAVFSDKGYYFTDCSTKAANQGLLGNLGYERYADQGAYQPKNFEIGYIMFCDVALGRCLPKDTRHKNGIYPFMQCDSLVFSGLYSFIGVERVDVINPRVGDYQVSIPRSPIVRDRSIQKISAKSTDYFYYDEYYVQTLEQINPRFLARVLYEYDV